VALPSWQLLPVIRRLLLGSSRSVSRRLVTERTSWRRVEVKHQREDGLAGHVEKLDLAPAQVLSSRERVDLANFGCSLGGRGVVVRILDVDFSSRLAGEDVRLAAAEPDVSSGPRGFGRDFIILETEWVQTLEALDLLPLSREKKSFCDCMT